MEAAKEAACRELGVESYEAEFEVLELPVKKTFGLFGGSPAKVRAFVKTKPAQVAAEYLREILKYMGVGNVEFSIAEEENGAVITITGDDIGFIIGHRGETLDALQYLSGLVSNHVENSYYRITLDIGCLLYTSKTILVIKAFRKKLVVLYVFKIYRLYSIQKYVFVAFFELFFETYTRGRRKIKSEKCRGSLNSCRRKLCIAGYA